MGLSNLSNRCIYIPPIKTERVLSNLEHDEITKILTSTFANLKNNGVNLVLGVGGMNLNYKDYRVPEGINFVMLYHTPWSDLTQLPEIYPEIPVHEIEAEFEMCKEQISFIPELAQYDYRQACLNKYNAREMEFRYGTNWKEYLEIDYSKCITATAYEENLLHGFLKTERILVGYNMNRHRKLFKSAYNTNKTGIRLNITNQGVKYFMHGLPIRENLIIK